MKLTEHLQHIIVLVEKGESPAKIKASLVAMSEEVAGYEQAIANAVKLAEKKPAGDAQPEPRLIELQKAILDLKRELEAIKNKPPPEARWG